MKKLYSFIAVVLMLAAASLCWGQMGTKLISSTYSQANSLAYCGGTTTCWHQSWGHPIVLAKVYAVNNKVLGIDSNNTGYEWNGYPANTWTHHPEWGAVYSLQADSHGNIWALQTWCGSGYELGKWNGSGFTDEGACYQKFIIAQDGSDKRYGVDINGTLWVNDAGGTSSSWQHFPFPPPVAVNSIAAINDAELYVAGTNGDMFWYNHTNGTWTQLPGWASVGYGTDVNLAIDNSADLYVIGNTSKKSVYYYNGSAWVPLAQNGFNSIAVANNMLIFGVGATDSKNGVSNNLYRFNPITVKHTRTFTLLGANCINCVHTQSVRASWVGANFGDNGQQVVYSPKGQTETVTSSAILADPFSCVEADPNCTPVQISHLLCTDAGTLDSENQDDKPIVITLGSYIDVENWERFASSAGPINISATGITGVWSGIVNMYITQDGAGCPGDSAPTCRPSFNPSQMFTECGYEDAIENAACEGAVQIRMNDTITGADDPYVWAGGYMRTQYPDGSVTVTCQPVNIGPNAFLYKGAAGPTPQCQ